MHSANVPVWSFGGDVDVCTKWRWKDTLDVPSQTPMKVPLIPKVASTVQAQGETIANLQVLIGCQRFFEPSREAFLFAEREV